jgi:hypothetical protein
LDTVLTRVLSDVLSALMPSAAMFPPCCAIRFNH